MSPESSCYVQRRIQNLLPSVEREEKLKHLQWQHRTFANQLLLRLSAKKLFICLVALKMKLVRQLSKNYTLDTKQQAITSLPGKL